MCNVLLIEDDAATAELVADALVDSEMSVTSTLSGVEGLALGMHNHYDAIVMNVEMPDIPGLEILRRWSKLGIRTPVIMLAAQQDEGARKIANALGARAFFVKPFEPLIIAERVELLTDLKRQNVCATAK